LIVPAAIVAFLTVAVRATGFDLEAQKLIYRAGGDSWMFGDHHFWRLLYDFGTLLPTALVIGAAVGYSMSWYRSSLQRWRGVFLYLTLTAVIGPGIITNAVLKEYWGRPRPRQVEEFGGHNRFEEVLKIDKESDGKSFPCGHATMGFYFMAGFFLLRRHRRELAEGFLAFGVVAGGVTGIARMAQGAHFFSDVVWAGAVCYFTSMGLYYALKLDRGLVRNGLRLGQMPLPVKITAGVASVVILAAVLVASPYRVKRNYFIVSEEVKKAPLVLRVGLTVGEADIVGSEELRITGEAWGHGMPTSGISDSFFEKLDVGKARVSYLQRISGWLAEVNEQLRIEVPWERLEVLLLETSESRIWIKLSQVENGTQIRIVDGIGEVHFEVRDEPVKVRGGRNATIIGREKLSRGKRGANSVQIEIKDQFRGRVLFESPRVDTAPETQGDS
jgi:membrane-associated PAP2 superfamily phosphatase